MPVLVFGPALPPGGVRGILRISSLGIEVSTDAIAQRLDVARLKLRCVGFEKPGVEVAWRDGDDTWAVHILDHDHAWHLLTSAPLVGTPQVLQLQSQRRRGKVGRTIGWSLLAAFILVPVILLLMLVLNANSIAGWVAGKVPVEEEMRFGRQAFDVIRGNLKLKNEGADVTAVRGIVSKLTAGSSYRYDVYVSDDPALNAFAMPGGIVVVNTGLISATKRPEELAGVLAHEVQHVELRHSLRGMIKDLGLRGLWSFATGDLGGTLAGQATLKLTSLKFSRDDEAEADQAGFEALVDAGIDPSGMPGFFKTISEQAADASVALVSTHPLSADREAALMLRVGALPAKEFVPLDFGAWPPG